MISVISFNHMSLHSKITTSMIKTKGYLFIIIYFNSKGQSQQFSNNQKGILNLLIEQEAIQKHLNLHIKCNLFISKSDFYFANKQINIAQKIRNKKKQ